MPPQPRAPPRRLTQQQLTYYSLGLPIGLIAVSVGIVGMFIIMGKPRCVDQLFNTLILNAQTAAHQLRECVAMSGHLINVLKAV